MSTTCVVPDCPEELLDPSKQFIKSPKGTRKCLSPLSSPTNSTESTSPRVISNVRTSFWNSNRKVDDISKAIRPSPPKNDGKYKKNNKHYKSPKVSMIVDNGSNEVGKATQRNDTSESASAKKNKRKNKRQRRSSIVHLGSVSGHHDDHHRVHELHTQITRLIEENKIDEHPESSKGSAVTETKNHQFKKDTISLSNNDAFDILHALNEFKAMLTIGSFNVHDPDHVEAQTVSHIVGEYSHAKKKFHVKDTWKRALNRISIAKKKEMLGVNLQDTIFQALGNLHQHVRSIYLIKKQTFLEVINLTSIFSIINKYNCKT